MRLSDLVRGFSIAPPDEEAEIVGISETVGLIERGKASDESPL